MHSLDCLNLATTTLCIFSGIEERDQLLSTEQMQSVIHISNHGAKRTLEYAGDNFRGPVKFQRSGGGLSTPSGSDSGSSEESLAASRMEELEKIVKNQEHYENLIAEEYGNSDDDSNIEEELPKLEVIDAGLSRSKDCVMNEESTDSDVYFRAPFVMLPEKDSMLYVPGCSPISLMEEDICVEEDNPEDLAARAPFVPPPNDDTILTFNDLPNSPLFTGFESPESGSKMPELYLEDPFDDKMVQIGPAAVPCCRVKKHAGSDTKAGSCIKKESASPSLLQSSKQKGSLPCISTTEAEMNAPSGRLLDGDDLLTALEAGVVT